MFGPRSDKRHLLAACARPIRAMAAFAPVSERLLPGVCDEKRAVSPFIWGGEG